MTQSRRRGGLLVSGVGPGGVQELGGRWPKAQTSSYEMVSPGDGVNSMVAVANTARHTRKLRRKEIVEVLHFLIMKGQLNQKDNNLEFLYTSYTAKVE